MDKPPVLKPIIPPAVVIIIDVSFKLLGEWLPLWVFTLVLGFALTWLIFSSVVIWQNVTKRWPALRDWLPFLDPSREVRTEILQRSNYIQGKTFRLVDAATNGRIVRKTFDDCVILGPGIMAPTAHNTIAYPRWISRTGNGLDGLFYEIEEREGNMKEGLIVTEDCAFNRCTFDGLGVAGLSKEEFRKGFDTIVTS